MHEPKQVRVDHPEAVVVEVVTDDNILYVNNMSEDLAASFAERYPEAHFFFAQLDSTV